jgi:1-acyl-sn-glycerol-3-phosphate acyltransferase
MVGRTAAWGRLLAVAVVVLAAGVLAAAGAAVLGPGPGARRRFRERLFQGVCRTLLAVLRVRVRVSGPLPRPPFLLVSNHLGYLDVLVLASRLPARFVAKAEVRRWPLLGAVCSGFGTIFIDRADRRDIPRVLAAIARGLADGEGVVLFPEGTSTSGAAVAPFRSPLLALPARRGLAVHAARLSYSTDAACWWGETAFFPHLARLCRLSGIEATVGFAEPVRETDRKRLAARLRDACQEMTAYGVTP